MAFEALRQRPRAWEGMFEQIEKDWDRAMGRWSNSLDIVRRSKTGTVKTWNGVLNRDFGGRRTDFSQDDPIDMSTSWSPI